MVIDMCLYKIVGHLSFFAILTLTHRPYGLILRGMSVVLGKVYPNLIKNRILKVASDRGMILTRLGVPLQLCALYHAYCEGDFAYSRLYYDDLRIVMTLL